VAAQLARSRTASSAAEPASALKATRARPGSAVRHAAADLDAVPRSVPAARHLIRLVLRSWGLEDTAGTTELITAELVTNAVAASAAARCPVVRLRLTSRAWSLLVQVWDASPGLPEPRLGPADAIGGRGLVLVAALADRWGSDPADEGGKTVYAEISR
jgi:anti-sigma regulatory factor (Ser/Thr protein kinase)